MASVMPRFQKKTLAVIFSPSPSPSTSDLVEPKAFRPPSVSQFYFSGSSDRRVMTDDVGMPEIMKEFWQIVFLLLLFGVIWTGEL